MSVKQWVGMSGFNGSFKEMMHIENSIFQSVSSVNTECMVDTAVISMIFYITECLEIGKFVIMLLTLIEKIDSRL